MSVTPVQRRAAAAEPLSRAHSATALAVAVALAFTAALGGCATAGRSQALPDMAAPPAWLQSGAAIEGSQADSHLNNSSDGGLGLADPVLERLTARALSASPDLRSSMARLREARGRRDLAQANSAPSVSGGASASRSRSSAASGRGSTASLFDAGFDASWELDLFGRLRAAADAAEADLAAAQATLDDAHLTLRAEVARNYIALRSLQLRSRIAADNLAIQSETMQIAQWRAQAGLVTSLDVDQALASREQTRAQGLALNAALAQSQLALELLLGHVPGALAAELGDSPLPALPALGRLSLPAEVLRRRADVRAAGLQWQAEAARSEVARANLRPRLNLAGSIGLQSLTLGSLADGRNASLLAGLTTPIFDAGRLRAQLETQSAVQERAAAGYAKTVLAALSEVETVLASLGGSSRQAVALEQAAAAARRAADLAATRYASGLIDFRSVLEAQRSALTAEDSLAVARTDALSAWVRLYKALAGPPDDAASAGPASSADTHAPTAPLAEAGSHR